MNKRQEREAVARSLELIERQAEQVEADRELRRTEQPTRGEDKRVA